MNFLEKELIKIPVSKYSLFKQKYFIFSKFLPTLYNNITNKEIVAISRLCSTIINEGQLTSLQVLLSDPVVQQILLNSLNQHKNLSKSLDFSNSILKNYTPFSIAHFLFINSEKEKKLILSSLKNKSGIYCWINKVSGNFYIGSATTLNSRMSSYFSPYFLNSNKTRNLPLSLAFKKLGYNQFALIILELCDNPDKLIEREQFWIDTLSPQYNILEIANSRLGQKHTEVSKAKIKKIAESRLVNPFLGKNHTIESRLKMSLSKKGTNLGSDNSFYGKKHTAETRELFKKIAIKREINAFARTVTITDTVTNEIKHFKSLTEAAKEYKACKNTISKYNQNLFRNRYFIVVNSHNFKK
jgi:group I intron endonuclease